MNSSVMPRLDENQRLRAIGMLQARLTQNVVARHFGCHRNTIRMINKRRPNTRGVLIERVKVRASFPRLVDSIKINISTSHD
jgi:hypothetical protein